ncbi:hypothetical protein ABGB18_11070 [Nonomuraea sp. B12E4]|uniref:hypothetical protein n=1 Tax=Nonomuraea sp. B12E4 TaxID=3153564 RepID=UPI00325CBD2E
MADLIPAEAADQGTADFLRVPLADGTEWVSLSRLTDGRVACCVCFAYRHRHELEPVAGEPGRVWDVCRECAQMGGANRA